MNSKLITLTEIAAEWPAFTSREHAEAALVAAGYQIRTDEIGRPCLALSDVKAWRETERRAEIAATARQAAFAQHQRDTKTWVTGREAAARAASRRASAAAGGSEGAAMGAGREAGTRAAEEYERTVPRPLFDGKPGVHLEYIDEGEAPDGGLLQRVAGRVRTGAR